MADLFGGGRKIVTAANGKSYTRFGDLDWEYKEDAMTPTMHLVIVKTRDYLPMLILKISHSVIIYSQLNRHFKII